MEQAGSTRGGGSVPTSGTSPMWGNKGGGGGWTSEDNLLERGIERGWEIWEKKTSQPLSTRGKDKEKRIKELGRTR